MKYTACVLNLFVCGSALALTLKEHEKWWQEKCQDKKVLQEFNSWVGNENAISRVLARLHMLHKEYKSVLDVGCGLCIDYDALKRSCPQLYYMGIDVASNFINTATARGVPAILGNIDDIPFPDASFDCVYARHILEHLDGYQKALTEMIRVARKEVMVVFFIKPTASEEDRAVQAMVNSLPIYHNRYSKARLEDRLKSMSRVKSWSWQEVKNKEETILHILIND